MKKIFASTLSVFASFTFFCMTCLADNSTEPQTNEIPEPGFPIWGFILIGAGVVLVALIFVILNSKNKK